MQAVSVAVFIFMVVVGILGIVGVIAGIIAIVYASDCMCDDCMCDDCPHRRQEGEEYGTERHSTDDAEC